MCNLPYELSVKVYSILENRKIPRQNKLIKVTKTIDHNQLTSPNPNRHHLHSSTTFAKGFKSIRKEICFGKIVRLKNTGENQIPN